ncbi:DNA-dependent protein kinase catalytic subunit [Caerostris extrusa]|uniref:DNA-dependent protein kinase catalytic subunit n=1 Tax=Caerostris extrusa TaxID=172846 RepID=A0AAV4M981_CAEEX|nr:DNA-dependent protein kinase catalytic subunit [Caerostris extrusa]
MKYIELVEFLDLMKKNKYNNNSSVANILKTWQNRFPNSIDPVDIWNDVVTNRGNFPVAVSTLKNIYKDKSISKSLDGSLWSQFIEAYCSINNRKSLCEPKKEKLNIVLQSWKQLDEQKEKIVAISDGKMNKNEIISELLVNGYLPWNIPSFSEFPQVLIESLLNALRFGSKDALLLFPRLLQVIENHHSCLSLFRNKTSEMPCWLFIGWIDQMLALLDKPEAKAVHAVIKNIVSSYPDAIIYSFHLSCSSYNFTGSQESEVNKCFVEKIKQMLKKHTVISEFVSALEHLSAPQIIFKDYVSEIEGLIGSNASSEKIRQCFTKMCENLFFETDDYTNRSVPIGPVQKKFSQEYQPKVLDLCRKDGSKLLEKSGIRTVLEGLRNLVDQARKIMKKFLL